MSKKFTLGSSLRNDIGNHLLAAMKELDTAAHIIYKESDQVNYLHNNQLEEVFMNEAYNMTNLKKEIKKILNRHFDDAAIRKFLEE